MPGAGYLPVSIEALEPMILNRELREIYEKEIFMNEVENTEAEAVLPFETEAVAKLVGDMTHSVANVGALKNVIVPNLLMQISSLKRERDEARAALDEVLMTYRVKKRGLFIPPETIETVRKVRAAMKSQSGVGAEALPPLAIKECGWTYDEGTCSWDTSCDEKHQFMNEGPDGNHHKFCPYCGGILKVIEGPMEVLVTESVLERKGYDRLWLWFGLSRAGWLTAPRVLLHEMPDEWQGKLAVLLEEYERTFCHWPEGIGTRVQLTDCGHLTSLHNWLNDYRYPAKGRIENLKNQMPVEQTVAERTEGAA